MPILMFECEITRESDTNTKESGRKRGLTYRFKEKDFIYKLCVDGEKESTDQRVENFPHKKLQVAYVALIADPDGVTPEMFAKALATARSASEANTKEERITANISNKRAAAKAAREAEEEPEDDEEEEEEN